MVDVDDKSFASSIYRSVNHEPNTQDRVNAIYCGIRLNTTPCLGTKYLSVPNHIPNCLEYFQVGCVWCSAPAIIVYTDLSFSSAHVSTNLG